VFKLSPAAGGGYTDTVLYAFGNGSDGGNPYGGLLADKAGNFYGTTNSGGAGYGVVFELSPASGGGYTEKVLHSFSGTDGANPFGGVVADSAGKLYGTTKFGGSSGYGTVYELSPASGGVYTETVLHSFSGADGWNPVSTLIIDSAGKLYGTTQGGGDLSLAHGYGVGTVFELSPASGGSYTEAVLYAFQGNGDGSNPRAAVVADGAGNFYSAVPYTSYDASHGSGSGNGLVFELSPTSGGYKQTVLHAFSGGGDGANPFGDLIADHAGNLYGTAVYGGVSGDGMVYELSPSSGAYMEATLYSFAGGSDGANPVSGLAVDGAGNVYGTTQYGGTSSAGVIYEIAGAIVVAPPGPAITIGLNPDTTLIGQSSTLSWSVANSTGATCTASGAWSGNKQLSGSAKITKLTAGTYTYTLSCTGPEGSDTQSAVLTVKPQPPSITIGFHPYTIPAGKSTLLTWSVQHASGASCTASGAWSGNKAALGINVVSKSQAGTYTYTLTCTNAGGTDVESAVLTVK
jgi:uncharacterized repeat protein (TIGR03803 family)